MTFVDPKSRFLHNTLQADVAKRAGRLRDYLCRPRSQSKLLRRPAVEVWESTTKPASSFSSFVVSVQTKISECFCWTSADVWQEETCEHLTCGRHLLPPAPPPPLRGPQEPPLLTAVWLRPAEELDSGTAHGSSIISPLWGL